MNKNLNIETGIGTWKFPAAWLFFWAGITFILRALPWRNFIAADGSHLFYGPDSYDHLRRISLGISSFPKIPILDYYYGYPMGTGLVWSPFFDYIISFLTVVFGSSLETANFIGFWASPVLAAITTCAVYFTVTRNFGRMAGCTAAAVIAIMPGHILYTVVSELDHHAAEPLLSLAILMSVAGWKEDTTQLPIFPSWFKSAVWMAAAILIWRGSVVFWGMAIAGLLLQIIATRNTDRHASTRLAKKGACLCISAAAMLTPVCLAFGTATKGGIQFGVVSWFHVILLACSAAIFLILSDLVKVSLSFTSAAIGLSAIAALLYLFSGRIFFSELIKGMVVVGRGDPWLDSISELRPMLFPTGFFQPLHSLEMLSLIYWIVPPVLLIILARWRKDGCKDTIAPLFVVWGGALWLMPLFRERYVHLAALSVAFSAGYAATWLDEMLSPRFGRKVSRIVLAVAVCLLISPTIGFVRNLPRLSLPENEKKDLPEALRFLREKTPATSYFNDPASVPEYGVLSNWGLGAYICYSGQRPTVGTNFGWETHGLFESSAFLTSGDPMAAEKILTGNRVRYLFLNEMGGELQQLRLIAEHGDKRAAFRTTRFAPLESMYYRLYIQDGGAYDLQGASAAALGRYRLIYESSGLAPEPVKGVVSHYKIFEHVTGAVIIGAGRPGDKVELALPLRTGAGRLFRYTDKTEIDRDGRFRLRLPYPTDEASGDVIPQGPYSLKTGGFVRQISIDSESVLNGGITYIK